MTDFKKRNADFIMSTWGPLRDRDNKRTPAPETGADSNTASESSSELTELLKKGDKIINDSQAMIDQLTTLDKPDKPHGKLGYMGLFDNDSADKSDNENTSTSSNTTAQYAGLGGLKDWGSMSFENNDNTVPKSHDSYRYFNSTLPLNLFAPESLKDSTILDAGTKKESLLPNPSDLEVRKLVYAATSLLRDYRSKFDKTLVDNLRKQIDLCDACLNNGSTVSANLYQQLNTIFTDAATALYPN